MLGTSTGASFGRGLSPHARGPGPCSFRRCAILRARPPVVAGVTLGFLPALVLRGVFEQFPATASEVDVRDDGLRFEHDPVVVGADPCSVELLGEVRHVVAEPQKVLLLLRVADLAGDLQLIRLVLDRAESFD